MTMKGNSLGRGQNLLGIRSGQIATGYILFLKHLTTGHCHPKADKGAVIINPGYPAGAFFQILDIFFSPHRISVNCFYAPMNLVNIFSSPMKKAAIIFDPHIFLCEIFYPL